MAISPKHVFLLISFIALVPFTARADEAALLRQIDQVRTNSSEECAQFFEWLLPYRLEYPGVLNFINQHDRFTRQQLLQPYVRLFEPKHLSKIRIRRMGAQRYKLWHDEVTRCLSVRLGPSSRKYREFSSLLATTSRFVNDPTGRRDREIAQILRGVETIEEYREALPKFFDDITGPNADRLTQQELAEQRDRYKQFENALWPSAMKSHKQALDAAEQNTGQRKKEEQLAALRSEEEAHSLQRLECLGYVDIDEPNLPAEVNVSLEFPEEGLAAAMITECRIIDKRMPNDPLINLAIGRLSYALERTERAHHYFTRAADLGSVSALAYLGDLEEDHQKALEYYQSAAARGFEPALRSIEALEQHVIELQVIEREELVIAQRLIATCDQLAAHPLDNLKPEDVQGVIDAEIDFKKAFEACVSALDAAPDFPRTLFQLGRALSLVEDLETDAIAYLEYAHNAEYPAASFYLSQYKDKREEFDLLSLASSAGFEPASARLNEGVFYPRSPNLTHIFADHSKIPDIPIANSVLRKKSFSVDRCTEQIFTNVRDDKFFQNEMNTFIAGIAGVLHVLGRSDFWDKINERIRSDAKAICLREARQFKQDYPDCLEPYWHEQSAAAISGTPPFILKIMRFYHSIPSDFERKALVFDEVVGEITDYAAILYFEEIGLDLYNITASDLGDDLMLKESTDPEILALVRDLKQNSKYEIAMNFAPPDLLCSTGD